MRIASFSSLNEKIGATGPKVSSRATSIVGFTPVMIVGSKNVPPSAWRLPPSAILPPLASASAMCSSTLATALSSISGPCSVAPCRPSPTRSLRTASTSFATNAS